MATKTFRQRPTLGGWGSLRNAARERAHALARPAPAAVGAGLLALAFIAISIWWIKTDKRVPGGDETRHLGLSFYYFEQLMKGHELVSFRYEAPDGPFYPPLILQVGMLAALIGGKSVDALQITQNLIFVPLFVLATYRAGTIAYDRLTGLLAVAFALGTPMMISQFHMFMLDMPLAAMAAAGVWLLLETRRFERRWVGVAAGVVLGLGLLTKQSYPFFIVPFVAVMVLRGGWRRPVNVAIVGVVALAIAAPWYLDHMDRLRGVATEATAAVANPWGSAAPRFSLENYSWYGWNIVNLQLLLPLTLFLAVGTVSGAVRWLRRRAPDDYGPELIAGAVGALGFTALWFGYHDPRYSFPAIVFMAILGTSWVARSRGRLRVALIATLGAVVLLNTISVNLGVFGQHRIAVPGGEPRSVAQEHRLTVITNYGYVVGKPERAGDILEIMRAARRDGIKRVGFNINVPMWMDPGGLGLFASLSHLKYTDQRDKLRGNGMFMVERPLDGTRPRPCARLPDGAGLYLFRGAPPPGADPRGAKNLYCPPGTRSG